MRRNPRYPSTLRNRAEFLRRKAAVPDCVCMEEWEIIFTCWCGVEQLSGREYAEGDAIYWENETKFTIRYRRDVFPDMRIRLEGSMYEITAITDRYNRHEALEIVARLVNGEGPCRTEGERP